MRLDLFQALAPVCPRCLHQGGKISAVVIADRYRMRGADLWHGTLNCADRACWAEFPVIDGVPILTPDPGATLNAGRMALSQRADLPAEVEGLIGDAAGAGSDLDQMRQHLSLYAGSQFADWAGSGVSALDPVLDAALPALADLPAGPVIDIGGGTGRGGWQVAARTGRMALVCDLNLSFLRFAQTLCSEGQARFPRRRIGMVFDPVTVTVPSAAADAQVDFWALDATALPFADASFALALLVNVVDCVPDPPAVLAETARVLASGGGAAVTTPYDWSPNVTAAAAWLGGHSQRGPEAGAGEPALRRALVHAGLTPGAEIDRLPWPLRLHDRAEMIYRMHLIAARKA